MIYVENNYQLLEKSQNLLENAYLPPNFHPPPKNKQSNNNKKMRGLHNSI